MSSILRSISGGLRNGFAQNSGKSIKNRKNIIYFSTFVVPFCFVVKIGIFSVARRFKSEAAATEESRREIS